ncbi:MAG: hypothetical protein JRI23_06140, partial [Deltaproteobacteria bacterium]|nr:hypothetical protein [Deltaproteobacteria bacterium]MBW2531154.1 hypothetical protein [Deltaproteobacteria bacterium]
AVGALGLVAVEDPTHPAWPLAVAIPTLAALRLPGAPRLGGPLAYACWTIATVCLTHALFFGEDRYHLVVTPLLCLLAACALRSENAPTAAEVQAAGAAPLAIRRRPSASASA